jgi:dienelactone hydrolase
MDEGEDGSDDSLDDAAMVAVAEIPVERATGPVLLLSGEDDQMWPSARLSRIAEARAERLGAGDRVTHVAYPDGGHQVGLPPGYPLPSQLRHPVNDVVYPFGGTRVGNQAARRDAWRRILELVEAPLR